MVARAKNAQALKTVMETTPARIGVGRAGTRPTTQAWLNFRLDHALARDAVNSQLSAEFLDGFVAQRELPVIQSLALSRDDYILFPLKGKRTTDSTIASLLQTLPLNKDVQIVIADGLSARAVEANVPDLLSMLEHGFENENISCGRPVVVNFGRVAVADPIVCSLGATIGINLIGERPGLSSAESLSAYITYKPGKHTISSDRTVVSNIHSQGTPAVEAGAFIVKLVLRIMKHKLSGVRLQQLS
jgi:ethanolamine ammonia-lyase small subunit